jgi:rsbT co-antagonist protein RsbR
MSNKETVIPRPTKSRIPEIVHKHEAALLSDWGARQTAAVDSRVALMSDPEQREHSRQFLAAFRRALQENELGNIRVPAWEGARGVLDRVSTTRAQLGFSSSETATFVLSLKEPLFQLLRREIQDSAMLVDELWTITALLDQLALYVTEVFQKSRESVIARQQQELLELSTPVVTLWEGVLALPLIGTLDSARTQVVMESLLERIVATGAQIAIIDITGVPTVDTLVAQHLLKTVAAARLMGADCLISGIRPQIAQTIVHLGVELGSVATKATLADAFALALVRTGKRVVTIAAANAAAAHPGGGGSFSRNGAG